MDLGQNGMLRKGDLAHSRKAFMTLARGTRMPGNAGWRRFFALVLTVVAIGLPVNHVAGYALLLVAAVVIFTGEISMRVTAWGATVAIVGAAIIGQFLLAPPRIDEGHNLFLPGGPGVLEKTLPADVYRFMANEFDAQYPPARRCKRNAAGCWLGEKFPEHEFVFSADGVFHRSPLSRAVSGIDFSDPVWLRLGFTNDNGYNWYSVSDVQRAQRDRRFWMGWDRWHLTMPWYVMFRLPAAFIGSELCWRGDVLWPGGDDRFIALPNEGCRAVAPADAGRGIFGIAIKPGTLAMNLTPPLPLRLRQYLSNALIPVAVAALILLLVRVEIRRTVFPFILIALALAVIAIDDMSFIGGMRPFDGGDDGLFYDGVGRMILQKFLSGDFYGALQGGENVFYYGGPGLRYFRAVEHVIFGETYLGYLSLTLLLPFTAYALFGRFLDRRWAIAMSLLFVAVPAGAVFGTTFFNYATWAARGFADPAAYILFICGLPLIVGAAPAPADRFLPAFFGALLFALAIFMKPIVAPAAAVMLGGCGLAALYGRQWPRLAGLCIGFLPVFSMALHNWIYGHVFVLLSANAAHPDVLVMPPSAWLAALTELLTLHWAGPHLLRALMQIPDWLSGPAESFATVPLNALGVVVLIYVVGWGRRFDPWLRLIGAAALAQHVVALFYVATARYHFLTWFLTMLVDAVWLREIGIGWLRQRFPDLSTRISSDRISMRLASGLTWLQKVAS